MSKADFGKKALTFLLSYAILTKVLKLTFADVAELADARDLKSRGKRFPCRFDPGHRHHVGASLACSDFFVPKKSIAQRAAPPLPQKVTFRIGYVLASADMTPISSLPTFCGLPLTVAKMSLNPKW